MAEETEPDYALSPLDNRMWAAIDELQECANLFDAEAGDDATSHDRCHIVASLMYMLFDEEYELFIMLGGVADCLVEIIKACKEDKPAEDARSFQGGISHTGH